jgi:hypothetical protein
LKGSPIIPLALCSLRGVNTHYSKFYCYSINWLADVSLKVRIIFRLCEYSQGLSSTILQHEAYQYCLDSLPMFTALLILSIIRPGRIMPGQKRDIPNRKERDFSIKSKGVTDSGRVSMQSVEQRTNVY